MSDVYCYAEKVPTTNYNNDTFVDSHIEYATLHVPTISINDYKAKAPWSGFNSIVSVDGTTPPDNPEPEVRKCATPTISYVDGKLSFSSETEGAQFVTDITDADIKKHYDAEITLTKSYIISVYAIKTGYDNSDVATATLTWIEVDPRTGGLTTGVNEVKAVPVLIRASKGVISVNGADDGMKVEVYGTNGVLAGSAHSYNGTATVNTTLQPGTVAIVKVGEKSVKVAIK